LVRDFGSHSDRGWCSRVGCDGDGRELLRAKRSRNMHWFIEL